MKTNTLLQRYLGLTILGTVLLVLLVLQGLDFFFTVVREMSKLGRGDYGVANIFQYALLSLPNGVYAFFPIAALLGTLLGLGTLASHSELTVIRASGVSLLQITKMVLVVALLLMVLVTIIGEWVAPKAEFYGKQQRSLATSGGKQITMAQGLWIREGEEFVHIDAVLLDGELTGVTRYHFDSQFELEKISFAKSGQYQYVDETWELFDIRETQFLEGGVETTTYEQQAWASSVNPELLTILKSKAMRLPMAELKRFAQYLESNDLDATEYQLAFWRKLFQPFATAVMMLLAIPFVFGPLRSGSMGLRMLVGIFLGLSFYAVNEFFAPFSQVFHLAPPIAAALPSCLFAGLGFYLMRRFA